jgi:hypothetical protein
MVAEHTAAALTGSSGVKFDQQRVSFSDWGSRGGPSDERPHSRSCGITFFGRRYAAHFCNAWAIARHAGRAACAVVGLIFAGADARPTPRDKNGSDRHGFKADSVSLAVSREKMGNCGWSAPTRCWSCGGAFDGAHLAVAAPGPFLAGGLDPPMGHLWRPLYPRVCQARSASAGGRTSMAWGDTYDRCSGSSRAC